MTDGVLRVLAFAGRPLRGLTKEQLLKYHLADPTQDGDSKQGFEILHRVHEGLLTRAEVNDFYKVRYQEDWNRMAARYFEGKLFRCQTYGWHSFLNASLGDILSDLDTYKAAEGLARLVGADCKPITALYQFRIMPSKKHREKFLNQAGNINTASLTAELQAQYRKESSDYEAATRLYGWGDDQGIPQ